MKKADPQSKDIEAFGPPGTKIFEIFVPPSRLYFKSFLQSLKRGPKFSSKKIDLPCPSLAMGCTEKIYPFLLDHM